MRKFLESFYQAYSGFSSDDPYGTLAQGYESALLSAFATGQSKLKYIYMQNTLGKIAAVSAITVFKPYSFAYCVGITPSFRNKGLSKILLQYHKSYAFSQGCKYMVVQTQKDSFVEELYVKNGFQVFEIMNYYRHQV